MNKLPKKNDTEVRNFYHHMEVLVAAQLLQVNISFDLALVTFLRGKTSREDLNKKMYLKLLIRIRLVLYVICL